MIRFSFANYVLGSGITGYVGFANYAAVLTSAEFWHSILITVDLRRGRRADRSWCWASCSPGWSISARRARVFRAHHGAPLFTMEVAIGYLGVTLFTAQGGLIACARRDRHPHSVDVDRRGGLLGAIILDVWRWTSFIFLIVLAGLAGIPNDALRRCGPGRDEPLAGHVAPCDPAGLAGDDDRDAAAPDRALKVFGLPFALTSGGPGTSTQLFSTMDYLTTIQFFDFGKGSAMGIIFLILVSVVITIFFRRCAEDLD